MVPAQSCDGIWRLSGSRSCDDRGDAGPACDPARTECLFRRANRFLARHAREIALSWENTSNIPENEQSKVFIAGMPVREAFRSIPSYTPPSANGEIRLLIVGGSLGATVFGETVPEAISRLPVALRQRLVITQQARKDQIDAVRNQYENAGVRAELRTLTNMPEHLGQTHLVTAVPEHRALPNWRQVGDRPCSSPSPGQWMTTRQPMPKPWRA